MKKLPQAIVIVDPKKEEIAIREARILNIPIFGVVDTNCDPDMVDYVIPGNDDAVRSVKIMLGVLTNAICEVTGKDMVDYLTEDDKNRNEKRAKKEVSKKEEVKVEVAPEVKEIKEEKAVEVKEEVKNIDVMNLTELKALAKEKGIKGYSKMKKEELLEVLK